MSTIRFEDVSITAKGIEIEGIENPEKFLGALGLVGAKVHEFESPKDIPEVQTAEPIKVDAPKEEPKRKRGRKKRAAKKSKREARPVAEAVDPDVVNELMKAKRISSIVQTFMSAGIDSSEAIVTACLGLADKIPLLQRVADIETSIPIAVTKWHKANEETL